MSGTRIKWRAQVEGYDCVSQRRVLQRMAFFAGRFRCLANEPSREISVHRRQYCPHPSRLNMLRGRGHCAESPLPRLHAIRLLAHDTTRHPRLGIKAYGNHPTARLEARMRPYATDASSHTFDLRGFLALILPDRYIGIYLSIAVPNASTHVSRTHVNTCASPCSTAATERPSSDSACERRSLSPAI